MSSMQQVRAAALSNYAEVARALGLDPFAQLRAAGLDRGCLEDPELRIPAARVHALLEASAQASGAEDFGLRMGMSRRLSNLGLIALAAREEPTVRAAVLCLQRTLHLHNEALGIVIEEANGIAVFSGQVLARIDGPARQAVELTVAVLFRCLRELLGPGWSPLAVCFTHAPPRELAPYQNAFGQRVQFNSVLNGLTLRAHELERAMPHADPQSLRTIRQYLDASAGPQPTQAERCTRLILGLLSTGRCSVELVARYLGVDRRTLHRWLEAEGTSYSALLEAVRREAAQRLLANPGQSVTDLAPVLGFADASALSRWFSAAFGVSPRAWRAARTGGAASSARRGAAGVEEQKWPG